MTPWDVASLAIVSVPALFFTCALVATILGARRLPRIQGLAVDDRGVWPRVSIVVPACDEELAIEGAMRSLLAQRYPDVQVVAVDDRSRDATGALLERLADGEPRLAVVHVTELPPGWLGKVHALHQGVARADGEWLLFADADAHLGPETLKKCISYADARSVDFVSVLPDIASAGFLGDTVLSVATAVLCLGVRPWRLPDPRSESIGATGAFMLVRRAAFERTPGFAWLKLEVADDFGLCLMIKKHGGRCEMLVAQREVEIVWYRSLAEIATKMQKNFFGITGRFSVPRMLAQSALLLWLGLFPLAALLPGTTLVSAVPLAAALLVQTAATLTTARWLGRPLGPAFFPSVGCVLLAWLKLRSALVGARLGGIEWRGVVYPTALLRGQQRVTI